MKANFMGRVVGFTVALKDWLSDGCPLRDPEETKELFETYCLGGCPNFIPKAEAEDALSKVANGLIADNAGFCSDCGCVVSDDPVTPLNRVNKPFKGCPLKHWLPIVEIPDNASSED